MRILILSNFYRVKRAWGYTQLCEEVSERLQLRGHRIFVLTSDYERRHLEHDDNILRELKLESDPDYYRPASFFTERRRNRVRNQQALEDAIRRFNPDVAFVWGMWNLSKTLAAHLEAGKSTKVAYYLSDHWPVLEDPHERYWKLPANRWFMRPVKRILGGVARSSLRREAKQSLPKFENAFCVSDALRRSLTSLGAPVSDACVIHNGIDISGFAGALERKRGPSPSEGLRLLYAGRLSPEKGAHTAVNAVARLVRQGRSNLTLSIVGEGHPEYCASLLDIVRSEGLEERVLFHDRVSRDRMPEVLEAHDALIFPSICVEALPRMPQEAMACGLPVIGTATGGTEELLIEGETGLTFVPEDEAGLAAQISRLLDEPKLRSLLAETAFQLIEKKFTIERMVDQIETVLRTIVQSNGAAAVAKPRELQRQTEFHRR
jgi:glycogen synthase